jgi:ribonuclease-3
MMRLQQMLGFVPGNISIYKTAFYHKSTLHENNHIFQSNERLEFLGDALLSTIVAEYLFKKYPNADEGFLTKMRSKIVKRKTLNDIATQMEIDVLLREYNNTRISSAMLGNALEAMIGAVYLDKGYRKTKHFIITKLLKSYLNLHKLEKTDDNFKSQLLEWCQKNGREVNYRVVNKYKQENRDRFKVAVYVDGKEIALADAFNKKSAEQSASRKAISHLHIV